MRIEIFMSLILIITGYVKSVLYRNHVRSININETGMITPLTRKERGELSRVHLTGRIRSAFQLFIVLLFRTHDLVDMLLLPCHGYRGLSKAAITINNNIQH